MFPDLLCQELGKLQSAAPAHSWEFSEKMMESSLGLPENSLLDIFDDFQKEPLASGSIAQIYKAHLDGQPVAVKIRHPRVAQLIDMDFRIMSAFARVFDYIPGLSWLHLRESVEQFSHTMAAQAHLQVEAHHLEVLNNNFRKWPTVKFPSPIYANSAVIIETFEPGAIVSDMIDAFETLADADSSGQSSKKVTVEEGEEEEGSESVSTRTEKGSDIMPVNMAKFIVTTGVGLYLKMLLVDNLMVRTSLVLLVCLAISCALFANMEMFINSMLICTQGILCLLLWERIKDTLIRAATTWISWSQKSIPNSIRHSNKSKKKLTTESPWWMLAW
jgi:aarF domain-containing kinase